MAILVLSSSALQTRGLLQSFFLKKDEKNMKNIRGKPFQLDIDADHYGTIFQ